MHYIEFHEVTKIYPTGGGDRAALDGISFAMEKGEFLALTGPSGCGKSTLLHILGGLDRPTAGKVYVDGIDLYAKNESGLADYRRNSAGIVYQFYNLVPELTAEENLSLPMLLNHRKVDKERIHEILEFLGMADRHHHYPDQLSGGQQQRIAIGRAMVNRPGLILADEPTGNLDTGNRDEILDLFRSVNKKEGATIFLVTHDPAVANAAGRNIHIQDGKITGYLPVERS